MPASQPVLRNRRVTVSAAARLHLGFLDLGGSLGRRFGSIGIGVNEIVTRLTLTPADTLSAEGTDADRALRMAERFAAAAGRPCPAHIHVERAIPSHAGLGSGTQLALAVGVGLSRLHGLEYGPREVAAMTGRGARSGVGVAVFERGGLVVDGGRGPRTEVPPLLARLEMPSEWRFLLLLDEGQQGLHGPEELEAFRTLPPFPADQAARLCHLLLMQGLPAVAERDLARFGAVVTELQAAVGAYFAPAQGGCFTSRAVGAALDFLQGRGAVGIGQSSWGPTGFCLVESDPRAQALLTALRERQDLWPGLRFLLATPRNFGADIAVERGDRPA
ncbi:beta-ribofuranosylaminobenzene 5'-phosphate synthase family protein [Candidatus Methylocalor cossyra]|uniref:Beta-RFAP synthase n=1 Tax=Candidatus Methylocalor cossyra TaxID=3108543 RepID=A0ABM9NEF8_9GAMM